jgi:hypothetical protein
MPLPNSLKNNNGENQNRPALLFTVVRVNISPDKKYLLLRSIKTILPVPHGGFP